MRYFITTAIVALAAAKAKTQAKDRLNNQELRNGSDGKRGVVIKEAGPEKQILQLNKNAG